MTDVTTATRCHNPRPGELGGHKTMAAVFFTAHRNFASVGTVGTRAERRALPARKSAEDRYECDRPDVFDKTLQTTHVWLVNTLARDAVVRLCGIGGRFDRLDDGGIVILGLVDARRNRPHPHQGCRKRTH